MNSFLFNSEKLEDVYFALFIKDFEDFVVNIELIPLKWSDKVNTLLIFENKDTKRIVEEYKELVEDYLQKNNHKSFLKDMLLLLYPNLELVKFLNIDVQLLEKIAQFNYNIYDELDLSRFGRVKLRNPAYFNFFFSIENEIKNLKQDILPKKKIDVNKIWTNRLGLEVKDRQLTILLYDENLIDITEEEVIKEFEKYEPWKISY